MPFDMAPQETKVGQFQKFADAMLRGCAATEPSVLMSKMGVGGWGVCIEQDASGRITHACAYFAMLAGFGRCPRDEPGFRTMRHAYEKQYGRDFVEDYEYRGFTREQIAARIAAL